MADAWLDTNRVNMGESVLLTVKAGGRIKGEPDISPLKKDFDILGSSSSSNMNIVNGKVSSSKTWYYQLAPKKTGRITVPSLEINGEHTPELVLEISGSDSSSADSSRDIFIETACTPDSSYIQQQILCTVRLFSARDITEGSLSAPEQSNTVIQQIGKDRDYHTVRDSRRFRVIERKYAVFPQESGELIISPPVFSGSVVTSSRKNSRDPFSSFMGRDPFFSHSLPGFNQHTRHVRISGRPVPITVKPRPSEFKGSYWLPAKSITLSQKWEPEGEKIHTGDPVTRTVFIKARGLTGEQLPDLIPDAVPGFRIYPDRPDISTTESSDGLTGRKTLKIVFIPEKEGVARLPAVELPWWNTRSGKTETTTLPGRRITVLPAPGTQGKTQPQHAADTSAKTSADRLDTTVQEDTLHDPSATRPHTPEIWNGLWKLLSATLGILWIITLYLLWQEKHRAKRIAGTEPHENENKKNRHRAAVLKKRFLAACRKNNAREAKDALILWAAALWPESPPTGIEEVASRLRNKEAAEELHRLNRILYSSSAEEWRDGARLAALTGDMKPHTAACGKKNSSRYLPPLYPAMTVRQTTTSDQ